MDPNRNRLLLVDPDDTGVSDLTAMLESAGWRMTVVATARAALELVRREVFDVLVCDVLASRAGDVDLLERVKRSNPNAVIIATADFEATAVEVSAHQRGADQFLRKPVPPEELVRIISELTAQAEATVELDLVEYLQVALLVEESAVLQATDRAGGVTAVYVRQGTIVHAKGPDREGEEALTSCLVRGVRSLIFLPWCDPDTQSIDIPATDLLQKAVESMRRERESPSL
jgi:CheY-like chemotaxis protein